MDLIALGAAKAPKSFDRCGRSRIEHIRKCVQLANNLVHYQVPDSEIEKILILPERKKKGNAQERRLRKRNLHRLDKLFDDNVFLSKYGRFLKNFRSRKAPSRRKPTKVIKKKAFDEVLGDSHLVAFSNINVIHSDYKVMYKLAHLCVPIFVNRSQFVLVHPVTDVYKMYEQSSARPHPKAEEYLNLIIARRFRESEIPKLMGGEYPSVISASYQSLVDSKAIDTKTQHQVRGVIPSYKRAGKKRASRMRRSALYNRLGIKRLREISQQKRRKTAAESHLSLRRKREEKVSFFVGKKKITYFDSSKSTLSLI